MKLTVPRSKFPRVSFSLKVLPELLEKTVYPW